MDWSALPGIQAKLSRANKHLQELGTAMDAFVQDDPHSYRAEIDAETNRWIAYFVLRKRPPVELSVIVGDVVHNLRSALDHLAYAMVPSANRGRTTFPIYDDAETFLCDVRIAAKRKRGPLPGLDPDSAEFAFIENAQPYLSRHGPKHHPLHSLRMLSNEDKHRTILASATAIAEDPLPEIGISDAEDVEVAGGAVVYVQRPLADGAIVMEVEVRITGPNPVMDVNLEFRFDIAFGKEMVTMRGIWAISESVTRLIEGVQPPEA